MSDSPVPVVDIGPYLAGSSVGKSQVAAAVDEACRNLGFLAISGHDIDPDLIESMLAISREYFARPVDEKMRQKMPPDRYRGYTPLGAEILAASLDEVTPPDLKESFSIGPTDVPNDGYHTVPAAGTFFAPNMWPEEPASLREVWTAYYAAMEGLATDLMRIFALALGLPEDFFDNKVDKHITNFSVIHYPDQATPPQPGQLRAGAHTDYGSLTILYQEAADGGLQVNTPDGSWRDVPAIPGTMVVNLGDLMAEWTNDRWRSTLHRVVNPPNAAGCDRLSMPFFHQPNYDAVIECIPSCCSTDNPPRYGTTTSGAHVKAKIGKHREADIASSSA